MLNLSYTNFIRTTDENHVRAAQEFWKRCEASGDIYKKHYSAKYCVGCEMEKTDSELDNGRCNIHPAQEIELRSEENYFFRFSKYQDALLKHYDKNTDFVVPQNRQLEIRNFVKGGLQDFSISRLKEKMPWGIPVPGDDQHVMYVWFDALVNYISTLGWPDSHIFRDYWPGVQVAGKDNLRQQSAMWQAMLVSAGLPMTKQIFIHGFITADGQKMSKSLGNVVNPKELVSDYGVDAVRYYLLREIPSFDDGDFSHERMEERYAELANRLGNLVGRVATMVQKYFGGDVGESVFEGKDIELENAVSQYDFRKYFEIVFAQVDKANELIDKEAPFKLVKEDKEACRLVLAQASEMIRWIGKALASAMPATSEEMLRRFGDVVVEGGALFPRRN
jgi:methionyl-tRNA synthetase